MGGEAGRVRGSMRREVEEVEEVSGCEEREMRESEG